MADYYSIELRKPKPFSGFTDTALFSEADKILSQLPSSIEEAQYHKLMEPLAYIWANLKRDDRKELNQSISTHFPGLQVIRWLPKAKAIIEKQSSKRTKGGNGHVYFVLFDATKYSSTQSACGIYVGQSIYTPERRFKNHRAGKHASSIVQNEGRFILESLSYQFSPISRDEALRLEAKCLVELRSANLKNLPAKIIRGS